MLTVGADADSESEEEFKWFDPVREGEQTYFNLINNSRRTIETGEQIYYCYGNRTNKFLLLNYGFCFPNNRYDSFEFPLRLDISMSNDREIFVPELVDLDWQAGSNA